MTAARRPGLCRAAPGPYLDLFDPGCRAFQNYSAAERKAIQRNLRAWGYYRGGIDGSFGPGTYNAVVAYARDEGASGNLKSTSGAYAVYDGLIF